MAGFSGKKHPVPKLWDVVIDNNDEEGTETATNAAGNQRSGKKYLPVRISTARFGDSLSSKMLGSNRKIMESSSRKPIRNIHKLLESPKRTARKRLDNLYDVTKSNKKCNPTTIRSQVSSAKKLAPKTPVVSVTSNKKPVRKTLLPKSEKISRQSRLLQPGTITGTYIQKQNSAATTTASSKPVNNCFVQKNMQIKRPSDVPAESPQPHELSYNSSDENNKQPLLNYSIDKTTEGQKRMDSSRLIKIDKGTSPLISPIDEIEQLRHCCKCLDIIKDNSLPENVALAVDTNIVTDSKETVDQDLINDKSKTEDRFERPTVIVMQKETILPTINGNCDKSVPFPGEDGSYSEILNLQTSENSSSVNATQLFKYTENICTHLYDNNIQLNSHDQMAKVTSELMIFSNRMLSEQQQFLQNSISQHEENLIKMKLMLENVTSQLDKQKNMKSSMKLKEWSDLNSKKLSLPDGNNSDNNMTAQSLSDNCESNFKDNLESGQKRNRPKASEQRKNKKSSKGKSQTEEKENDFPKDLTTDSNQASNKIENNENALPLRRRSARLAIKNDGLSLPLEQSTPMIEKNKPEISQGKSKSSTPSLMTPARNVKWGRRSERPLREYMVLKSAMKFLNTPDSRRYRIGPDEEVQVRESLDKNDKAVVSDNLLKELHELYATP